MGSTLRAGGTCDHFSIGHILAVPAGISVGTAKWCNLQTTTRKLRIYSALSEPIRTNPKPSSPNTKFLEGVQKGSKGPLTPPKRIMETREREREQERVCEPHTRPTNLKPQTLQNPKRPKPKRHPAARQDATIRLALKGLLEALRAELRSPAQLSLSLISLV